MRVKVDATLHNLQGHPVDHEDTSSNTNHQDSTVFGIDTSMYLVFDNHCRKQSRCGTIPYCPGFVIVFLPIILVLLAFSLFLILGLPACRALFVLAVCILHCGIVVVREWVLFVVLLCDVVWCLRLLADSMFRR